jgi:hypothetical protein
VSAAGAALKGWERSPAANTVRATLRLAASTALPRVWLYARLLDFSHLNLTGRVLAFLYYRVCRQPPAFRDEDGSLKFHDLRFASGSRAVVRGECRDPNDIIIGLVYGRQYGERVAEEVTFCRPEHPRYREQDARDSLVYTEPLEEHFARRLTTLTARAEAFIAEHENA